MVSRFPMAEEWKGPTEQLDPYAYLIPKSYKPSMRTDGLIFADAKMMDQVRKDFAPDAGRERRDDARDCGPLDRDARDGHCRLHENLARARISVIGGSPLVHRFRVAPLTRGGPLATYYPIRGDRDAYGEDSDVYGRARAKERRDREQPR